MILKHSKGYPSVFDIDQRQQMIDHRHVSVRRKILHHKIFEKLVKSCHHSRQNQNNSKCHKTFPSFLIKAAQNLQQLAAGSVPLSFKT